MAVGVSAGRPQVATRTRYTPQSRVSLDKARIDFDRLFRVNHSGGMVALACVCGGAVGVVDRIGGVERNRVRVGLDRGGVIF